MHRPEEPVREQHHEADEDGHEQAVAAVAVADVGELVRDDTLQLLPVTAIEQSAGDHDRRG